MHRLLATLLLILVPALSGRCDTLCVDSLGRAGTPEGVWQMASGTIFRIAPRAGTSGVYDLTLLLSADPSVASGTLFGTMRAGADRHIFDASLASDIKGGRKAGDSRKRQFAITFDSDFSSLTLSHYRSGVAINLMRLVPYLFRIGIERHDDSPHNTIGASRCDGTALAYPIEL